MVEPATGNGCDTIKVRYVVAERMLASALLV